MWLQKHKRVLLPFGAALVSFWLRDVAGLVLARNAVRPGEEHGDAPRIPAWWECVTPSQQVV